MSNKITVIGRGGVGKTTFLSLLAKYIIEGAAGSILLIDADPDQSLADTLGIDLEKENIKTLSEILYDIKHGNIKKEIESLTLYEKVNLLLSRDSLYEGDKFDFLSIGTKWTEGCYCQPNAILKDIISGLEKNYDYILIDSPAGLEHLNRRVTSSVNTIFAIVDASKKSIENIKRSYKIISEVKIKFENFYVVGNYTFPDCEDREFFTDVSEGDVKYVGKIQYDDAVREYMMLGKSLLEIEKTSPAFISVAEIAKKTNIVVL